MSTPDVYGDTDGITLRDRMATRIFEAVEISAGCDCVVAVQSSDAVHDILGMVRDALLSDTAIDMGAKAVAFTYLEDEYPNQYETWSDTEEDAKEMFRQEYRAGITAALDAVGIGEATS